MDNFRFPESQETSQTFMFGSPKGEHLQLADKNSSPYSVY